MATAAPDSILIQSLADSHSGIGQNIEGSGATAGNPGAGAQSVNGQYVSSGAISGGGLGSGAEVSVTPGEGNVGSLSIAANGSYTLSVSNTAAQQFAPGEAHTETFVLQSADGSTHQLSFTVQQTPEGVSIGAPAVAVPDPVTGMFTDTQTAVGSFPVNAEGQVPSVQSLLGAGEPSLGSLSISDSGQYTYSVSTSASQAINANDTRAESFSVQTPDGGNQQISFTVHGAGQDGGIAQQPISVNVTGNDAGDGRVLPDDAALTALDASAVGFFRVPTDGPGVAAANTAIASARGAATTGITAATLGADAARSAAVAGLSDAGDSGPPISKAGVLQDDGAGLDRDAEVSEPGLVSPPVAPLALSNPIVVAAEVPVAAVVPDPPPEPTAEPAPAPTPEPAPAPVVALAPEPAVPPGPPEPPGPPVVLPVPSVIGAVLFPSVQEDVNVQPGNLLARTGLIEVTASTPALATFSTNVVTTSGNLGTLSIDALGTYSYNVSNAFVQFLGVADSKVDSFTIATADGTTKEVQFTILGTNDAATIGDLPFAAVTEDLGVIANQLGASGTLSVLDVDQNQSVFQTAITGAVNNLGTFVLAANGNYTYSVANAVVQYLGGTDSKIETFTVKSFDGTEKIEQVTIFGVNDAAVIGDLPVATVTEDLAVVADQLFARGTISITDVDQNQASFQTVVGSAAGNLGGLTLATDGQYTYSVANAAVQYLGALDTKLETFTVTSFDGTTKTEQVTIRGVNDAALITGPAANTVTEDVAVVGGKLTASGSMLVTDVDQNQSTFQTTVAPVGATLGTLVLGADGLYSFTVLNASAQYLGAADSKVDTFTVKSFDGTAKDVSFTTFGTNDAALIGDPTVAAVTESFQVVSGNLRASGTISVSDVDQNESGFQTGVTSVTGALGNLALAVDGSYLYSVANSAVLYLGDAETKVDTFTIKSIDGTTKDVSFTIHGVNQGATIGDPSPAAVVEDLNPILGRLTETGIITMSDPDTGEAKFQTAVTAAAGDKGQLVLAEDGTYTYSVANADVQYLGAGVVKTDTFTIKSFDGTAKVVSFTITGISDDAVIGGPSPAAVTEDLSVNGAGRLVESGRLTLTDVDTGEASFRTAVTAAAGDKGQLTLATDGSYTYSVLNTEAQYLGAGDTKTDTFTVTSFDGTAKDISFTITGVNDTAVIGNLSNNRVTEDLALVGLNLQAAGTFTVSDADQNQGFFSTTVAPTSGNIGTLVLDRNGNYVYRAPNQDTQYLRATDTKVDTFRIAALDGTSKDVSFIIQGVNDAAIIGAPTAAVVRENEDVSPDGFLSAAGTISISDVDQFESAFLTTVVPTAGTDGTLTLAADGSYTYKVDNSLHLYLPLNQVKTEIFTISSVDGTTKNIDFTIRGVNNPAQIGAPSPAAVTEDTLVGLDGKLTETGRITISDLDNGEAAFRTFVETGAGDKGQLTLTADGEYSYSVANSAVQYLGAGMTQVDTFVIKTIDGTAKTVSFTITGVNDLATISTPTPARVTEDVGAADGYLRTGGILTVTDADAGQSTFQTAVTALGSHIGALALASDGTYQYNVANAQVQYLGDGETKVESFTIKSLDGTSKDVSFTIIGVNDGAIIGDPTDSIVIENTELFRGNLVASGTISITDPDAGQSSFKTTVVPLVNTWGSLTLATDGAYTYSVANNLIALQALNEGQTKVDQFTISSFDGTKKVVDFTIKGIYGGPPTNVAPVVGPLIQQSFFVGDAQKNIAVGGPDETLAKDSQDGVNLNRGSATYWVDGKPVSQLPNWIKFAGFEQVINVDPSYVNADLFNLATGATKAVDINYVISDNNGGKVAQSAMITVTGKDIYTPAFSSTSGLTDIYSAGTSTKSIDLLEGVVKSPGEASMSIKNVVISLDGVEVQSLPGVSGPIGVSTTAFSIDTSASAYTSMATGQSKTAVISYDVVNTVTGNADLFKSMVQTEIITIVKGAAVAPATITGTSRSDVLRAADSGQTLIGVGGNDTLIGGKGNDVLISGGGGDMLTGGGGANTFKYVALADSPKSAATGTDTITDFSKSQATRLTFQAF